MTVNWEKKNTNDGILKFSISKNKIEKELSIVFNRLKKNLNIPGFRKGKIPREIFNRMYGEKSLYKETLNSILPDAYEIAVKKAKITPVSQPKINIVSMNTGEDWHIKAEITIKPEVKLGKYKNLSVSKQNRKVTTLEIEKLIKKKQLEKAELVTKQKKAMNGDTVLIDFEGFLGGTGFKGGTAQNYSLELGSGSFVPGFENQLLGTKAGDNVTINITFPIDYQAKDLAGKDVTFKVRVHEVKEKVLPNLDDQFAKSIEKEIESVHQLKQKYREDLEKRKIKEANIAIQEEAIFRAVKNAKIIDLPDIMVQNQIQQDMNEFYSNLKKQGLSKEQYYKITRSSEEDLYKKFREDADFRVKTNLVMEAISNNENIQSSEEDYKNEIDKLSKLHKLPKKNIRSSFPKDLIMKYIVNQKTIALIISTAKEKGSYDN